MENNENQTQGIENESNAAKRIRLLGIDSEDRIHDGGAEIKKGNFLSNLWYQHKWAIVIGTIFAVVLIVFLVQTLNKPHIDMRISYVGPEYIDTDLKNAIDYSFGEFMKDYDGNGEKNISFGFITYQNDEQRKATADQMKQEYGAIMEGHANYQALETFHAQLLSGMVSFYLLDEALYKENDELFLDMSDMLGYEPKSELMAGESGIYLKKTDFYRYIIKTEQGYHLRDLPSDTVICILPKITTVDEKMHKDSIDLLKSVLSFEYKN